MFSGVLMFKYYIHTAHVVRHVFTTGELANSANTSFLRWDLRWITAEVGVEGKHGGGCFGRIKLG